MDARVVFLQAQRVETETFVVDAVQADARGTLDDHVVGGDHVVRRRAGGVLAAYGAGDVDVSAVDAERSFHRREHHARRRRLLRASVRAVARACAGAGREEVDAIAVLTVGLRHVGKLEAVRAAGQVVLRDAAVGAAQRQRGARECGARIDRDAGSRQVDGKPRGKRIRGETRGERNEQSSMKKTDHGKPLEAMVETRRDRGSARCRRRKSLRNIRHGAPPSATDRAESVASRCDFERTLRLYTRRRSRKAGPAMPRRRAARTI